ncbi:SURP and G-patch domain-containing 1 [Paramuricea clavata]|uniref:SURP and G-patch domain-containing 1 n=1 Tax=Paramuricea clavata TaxID=317549 RepID=A0A7D9DIE2_PARCT|nr:SURP and G-patch domain-containing 1 [Paramuricea clavata]
MKDAIESFGGVPGVRVILCDLPTVPDDDAPKWEGISFINNFAYTNGGIRTWREYGIGPAKRKPSKPRVSEKSTDEDRASDHSDEESDSGENKLFSCPFEGCVKSYQRFSSLQSHVDIGKHKYALEHENLFDKAMLEYAKKLEEGTSAVQHPEAHGISQTLDYVEPLEIGWALKSSAKRKHFTPTQKEYLTSHFDIGEQTGHKVDAKNVSNSMRKAKNPDGSRLFQKSDFLSPQQIASFFSRLAKKRRQVDYSDTEDEVEEDEFKEMSNEENFENLTNEILNEISISHPIMFETHNICELATNSKVVQILCTYAPRYLQIF